MPKVSVIIPVYNVENYLRKCLDSVINQTLKDIEIICVDDGSTDGSGAILDKYAQKDERIRVIHQKNQGLGAARNVGIDLAKGEYIYFIDSDDYVAKNALEILFQTIENDRSDMVYGGVKCIGDVSAEELKNKQNWFDKYLKKKGIYTIGFDIRKELPAIACNKLYKKSIIDEFKIRFPKGLINEDEYWLWAYMIHCQTYSAVEESLYFYLQRPDSIMGQRFNSEKMLDIFYIDYLIYDTVKKYKNITNYEDILAKLFILRIKNLNDFVPVEYRNDYLRKIEDYYQNYNHSLKIKQLHQWLLKGRDLRSFFAAKKLKLSYKLFGFSPLLKIEGK